MPENANQLYDLDDRDVGLAEVGEAAELWVRTENVVRVHHHVHAAVDHAVRKPTGVWKFPCYRKALNECCQTHSRRILT